MNFRNKIAMFIAVLGLISLLTGSSYAIFTSSVKEEGTQLVTAGNVDLELEEKTQGLNLSNLSIMSDTEGMLQDKYYEFNLKNTSTTTVGYIISIINDEEAFSSFAGNVLDDSYIKVSIEVNNKVLGPYKLDEISRLLYDSYMLVGGKSNFKLRFWLDSSKATELSEMSGYATFFKVKVVATQYFEEEADYVEANVPKMEENMIALAYDEESHNWYKADKDNTDNAWYNYQESIWANAATVKSTSSASTLTTLDGTTSNCALSTCTREDYLKAEVGTIIPMSEINTMWVWIPRYKYTIFNHNEDGQQASEAQQINIIFEEGLSTTGTVTCEDYVGYERAISEKCNDTKFGAITDGFSTYTHPAFTFGNKPITGFWIGKFELSQNSADKSLEIKPDVISLYDKTISEYFEIIRSMELMNNPYGFASNAIGYTITGELTGDNNKVDTHLSRNMEWAATAYLSQSEYGRCGTDRCSDIYFNNSSGKYTGRSAGASYENVLTLKEINPDYNDENYFENKNTKEGYYTYDGKWSGTFNFEKKYQEDLTLGYKASTTGNIYGVYDMSGGTSDTVMANMRESTNTNFNVGTAGTWDTENHPLSKYYDEYSYGTNQHNVTSRTNSKLGDGYKEVMINNTYPDNINWYNNSAFWTGGSGAYIIRGGYYSSKTTQGLFSSSATGGGANSVFGARVALVIE